MYMCRHRTMLLGLAASVDLGYGYGMWSLFDACVDACLGMGMEYDP